MAPKKTSRFSDNNRVPLPGTERAPIRSSGKALPPPTGRVTVTVVVRRKSPLDPAKITAGHRLTRAQYRAEHAADPAAVKLVRAFAAEYGLTVEKDTPKPERRAVMLSGSVAALSKAFGATLTTSEIDGCPYRTREGAIQIPAELSGAIEAVFGLDNRPQAKPHFRVGKSAPAETSAGGTFVPRAGGTSYTPVQVAEAYGLPAGASASGQTIGIIELGGGYRPADITAYFKSLGLTPPAVKAVSVDKGKNKPTTASGADGEVMLDIEVAGAVAQGAKIVVYFAPNTDQGFIDAISTAVHDTVNKPSVISISWGGPETSWTQQALTALDQACQSAAVLGVTITVASGDDGSSDGTTDGQNTVDFPASSPHVLACGGTKLVANGTTITSEVVWNEIAANEGATGGGVSAIFPLPVWQNNAHVPAPTIQGGGRGVPDVAGDADPVTGYTVRVDGQTMVIGGTSAVAPLWAGLIAVANQQNGASAGFINPAIYAAKTGFRDITQGNNGAFQAGPGWDACTGLGSPAVPALIPVLAPAKSSGGSKPTGKKPVKKAGGKGAASGV